MKKTRIIQGLFDRDHDFSKSVPLINCRTCGEPVDIVVPLALQDLSQPYATVCLHGIDTESPEGLELMKDLHDKPLLDHNDPATIVMLRYNPHLQSIHTGMVQVSVLRSLLPEGPLVS